MSSEFEDRASPENSEFVDQVIPENSEFVDRVIPELWSRGSAEPKTQTDILFKCDDGVIPGHRLFLKMFCMTLEKCLTSLDSDRVIVVTDKTRINS
jgi:hypothetical protein